MSKDFDLKSTIHLPRTSFAMKANLPRREPEILDWWARIDVYGRVREAREAATPYVLHDGPPYANGNIHLGQALNKILKDFVVKSRSMMGHDARYVPGWDCHGLPIEHRVDKELGAAKLTLDPLEVRRRCREYAERFIEIQRREFMRLGVFWDHALDGREEAEAAPDRRAIYRTIDRSYEAAIVRQLGRFFAKDAVYHGVKPVHWCWSCATALAEAEVEYADRTDPSIFVALPIHGAEARVAALSGRDVAVVVWTTTPWTLPANMAVALHPDLDYVAVDVDGRALIVADGLLESVAATLGWQDPPVVARFTGRDLVGEGDDWVGAAVPIDRPYRAQTAAAAGTGVFVLGDHVTLEAGSGCVHTAPGHGADDFNVGRRYDLAVFNPVADDGTFRAGLFEQDWLSGTFVLDANAPIIDDLRRRGLLLHAENHRHSYPHCWRCRNPVLFRSTPQWFIAMEADGLRGAALEQIRATTWLPASGEARIAGMIENRPDWCISRQRTWGVPIPAVVCGACSTDDAVHVVRDPAFFEHVADLFAAEGSDAWFGVPADDGRHRPYASADERRDRLVPAGVACPNCAKRDGLEIHEHIVDVWFESGVSHAAVLGRPDDERLPWPADLYLEGHDQYRGWFHSSLLVAVNDRGRAPYREVVTHGFTLDGDGRKMSKSLGNVVSPLDIAGARGAEILRLWVASVDYLEDMRLSDESLDRNAEAYRKIRNTFRFLLGNLHDFDPARHAVPYERMGEIDRFALQRLEALRTKLVDAYRRHQYHAIYHGIYAFCTLTLSSFYLDILKDRLYTTPKDSHDRRATQTVLHRTAHDLCRLMAPVMCFTAEEIWQELGALVGRESWQQSSVHAETFAEPCATPDEALVARWERLIALRDEVLKALEGARAAKIIGTGLEACVVLAADDDDGREAIEFLRGFGADLHVLLQTSEVCFEPAGDEALQAESVPGLRIAVRRTDGEKCRRCWHFTTDIGSDPEWPTVCGRCARHVRIDLDAAAGS